VRCISLIPSGAIKIITIGWRWAQAGANPSLSKLPGKGENNREFYGLCRPEPVERGRKRFIPKHFWFWSPIEASDGTGNYQQRFRELISLLLF
jgi:hypothetical protein